MDGLSGAATVIAVTDISAKITAACYQYYTAVKDAKDDIERVQRKVGDITHILEKLKPLYSQDKKRLSTSHGLYMDMEEVTS
ncbi:hypothetical protein L13192_07113 [Pyrenophora tritici-repentis]|nr:hypothetical protein L13192_07113 [Pyrenophora tritici-repentis]